MNLGLSSGTSKHSSLLRTPSTSKNNIFIFLFSIDSDFNHLAGFLTCWKFWHGAIFSAVKCTLYNCHQLFSQRAFSVGRR